MVDNGVNALLIDLEEDNAARRLPARAPVAPVTVSGSRIRESSHAATLTYSWMSPPWTSWFADTNPLGCRGFGFAIGRLKSESPVWPGAVVMLGIRDQDAL